MNINHCEFDPEGNLLYVSHDLYKIFNILNKQTEQHIQQIESRHNNELNELNNQINVLTSRVQLMNFNLHENNMRINYLTQQFINSTQRVENLEQEKNALEQRVSDLQQDLKQTKENNIQDVSRIGDLIQTVSDNYKQNHKEVISLIDGNTKAISDLREEQFKSKYNQSLSLFKPSTVGNVTKSSNVNDNQLIKQTPTTNIDITKTKFVQNALNINTSLTNTSSTNNSKKMKTKN